VGDQVAAKPDVELNLSPRELYEFITNDFECAWKALAAAPDLTGRGNMIFARQAMSLLELALRVCASTKDAAPLRDFSLALKKIEPRYFSILPGVAPSPGEFRLPYDPDAGEESASRALLATLFDLVRHGLAHQYQTITVELSDGRIFAVSTSGADTSELGTERRPEAFLGFFLAGQALMIRLFPDVLYLDLKEAIEGCGLLDRGLGFEYLRRPRDERKVYGYGADDLQAALKKAGHRETPPPKISAATREIVKS
jgi:hypothetical protein